MKSDKPDEKWLKEREVFNNLRIRERDKKNKKYLALTDPQKIEYNLKGIQEELAHANYGTTCGHPRKEHCIDCSFGEVYAALRRLGLLDEEKRDAKVDEG